MSARPIDARLYESAWSRAWEHAGCDRAPDLPHGAKFYNYDSGPFTNGVLHMGHVRTYVLGDMTARYQRALGRSVLYCTEWDAFGMPIEAQAVAEGCSPAELARRSIATMTRQLRTLGISYDYDRIPTTCDPAYYRWTQWLFLRLWRGGLVERRERPIPYCPTCESAVTGYQVVDGRCWRCNTPVEYPTRLQWFVTIADASDDLLAGLDELEGWSRRIREIVRGLVRSRRGRIGGDWLVSRQRAWGTPVPVVHCTACGARPVPDEELPVRLPDDLDWSLGPAALATHGSFTAGRCPTCGGAARRDTDTLDCFFDDVWCFLAPLVDLDGPPGFRGERVAAWMPVDRFHSGFDTAAYLHLHRAVAAALASRGELPVREPISSHLGHALVLADGRKMGKHLGNAVSPAALIRRHGADAVRLAVLRAGAPHSAIDWQPTLLTRETRFIARVIHLVVRLAPPLRGVDRTTTGGSAAAAVLRERTARSLQSVARAIESYRPHLALGELTRVTERIEAFAFHRIETRRLTGDDAGLLRGVIEDAVTALVPFAPHLAEECWSRLGREPFVVVRAWPESR